MTEEYLKLTEGHPKCPNCKTILYVLDNSYAVWCMRCKWVEYRTRKDKPDGGVPSTD